MTHGTTIEKPRGVFGRAGATRAVVAAGLSAVVGLTPVTVAGPATAATRHTVSCTSAQAGLAAELQEDITTALVNRKGTIAIGLHDRVTDTTCTLRPAAAFDSASVVKVTVLAALLWDAKAQNRYLSARNASLAKAVITKSDNAATSTLWKQLGMRKIKAFLAAADMTRTRPGAQGHWGLTRINVTDELKLLKLLTTRNTVLSDNARAYILKLMGQVVPAQRWGTTYGVPSGCSVAVKNGWLPRATHGWRVHSVGTFKGAGHDYVITVLTHGNSTMKDGITTIQGVAKAIHKAIHNNLAASGS
ncbi:serine hydrolase [Streptomyces sp. NPDC002285]